MPTVSDVPFLFHVSLASNQAVSVASYMDFRLTSNDMGLLLSLRSNHPTKPPHHIHKLLRSEIHFFHISTPRPADGLLHNTRCDVKQSS
jgi:hypothetical protein